MSIEWTPAARARIDAPFRALKPRPPLDLDAAWSVLRTGHVRTDYREVAESLKPAEAAVRAALEQSALPRELDVDALAVWSRLAGVMAKNLERFLSELFGVERAIDVWLRTTTIDVQRRPMPAGAILAEVTTAQPALQAQRLRTSVLEAPPDVRARIRAKVAPLVESPDVHAHARAVMLFPEETEWAVTLIDRYLAHPLPNHAYSVISAVHRSACPLDKVREATLAAGGDRGEYEALLDTHGEAAVPLLLEMLDLVKAQYQHEMVTRALLIVRTPEVAGKLAEHVGKKKVRKHVGEYFQRFPELAEAALRPVAEGKGRAASMAAEMLAHTERAAEAESVEEAPVEGLPNLLVDPPWRGGARVARKPVVVKDAKLDGPRAWHGPRSNAAHPWAHGWAPMTPSELATWRTKALAGENVPLIGNTAERKHPTPEAQLEAWSSGNFPREHVAMVATLLATHGLDAAAGAIAWAHERVPSASYPGAIAPLSDLEVPELAADMALALGRRPTRELASRWLHRFPEAAIAGLLPAALGEKNARRWAAERALRLLVRDGHEERIRARAKELGKRGVAGLDELLGWDPLSDCPKKPPKLSARYRPEVLLRPTTREGTPLPLEAVRHLDEMLAFSPIDPPYAGLEVVAEALDARSLAEHAWSLARAWETSGARKTDDWMMRSLVHLADDQVVRRMTPALKNALVIEVLVAIGTDAAAMELATVGARGGAGAQREAAENALDRLAEARGIHRDRLDEQLTPTLGLDPDGSLALDYGARTFRIVFDEHLVPRVRAEDGAESTSLPRTRKGDDAEKVAKARERWDELREDLGAIADFRIQALQRAMLSGSTWSLEELESAWVHHPLMTHLARRMVFVALREGEKPQTFRIAEDGTYAGVDHEPVSLAPDARIGVPHALRWPDDSRDAWIETLVDYEIVQPFAQLAREAPAVDESMRAQARISIPRADAEHVDYLGWMRRLTSCGWDTSRHPFRFALEGDRFVHARAQSVSRGGVTRHEVEVVLREGTEEIPWSSVPRETLLQVLDGLV
ncbi:MAG: DUF4132 domain-containing protein [Sandaracinus sp.]|nr:DUF4132 domain-containing protein [Sandaracinus sp.]